MCLALLGKTLTDAGQVEPILTFDKIADTSEEQARQDAGQAKTSTFHHRCRPAKFPSPTQRPCPLSPPTPLGSLVPLASHWGAGGVGAGAVPKDAEFARKAEKNLSTVLSICDFPIDDITKIKVFR